MSKNPTAATKNKICNNYQDSIFEYLHMENTYLQLEMLSNLPAEHHTHIQITNGDLYRNLTFKNMFFCSMHIAIKIHRLIESTKYYCAMRTKISLA